MEAIGTFEGYSKCIGALIEIGDPLLVIIEPEALEEVPEDLLSLGWEEFNI